jgi:hypothetical protein
MTPQLKDITYYRGSTDVCSVRWLQSDGTTPTDLTGYTATMYVRDAAGTLLSSGISSSITANTGTVVFTITDAAAAAMPLGVHRHDVWLVSSGGIDYCLIYGAFTVLKETRNA